MVELGCLLPSINKTARMKNANVCLDAWSDFMTPVSPSVPENSIANTHSVAH